MFIDRVTLKIKAGTGGDGMISFRREKYVDKGGPSGGDGGRGGNIYFIADSGMSTLLDFKFQRVIEAGDGGKGQTKDMFGRAAEDIVIKVPVGTVVIDQKTNRIVADFKKNHQKELIARGGKGGRGNAKFTSSVNQVPRIAENGEPGEQFDAILELKLLADVGLVGYPSVGKSTILSVVSAAKPEIAEYHFTTIVPNLGVVSVKDGRNFVMADLPGLIEGAHQGKGLGLQFLRHIERCRVLLHVVDMASTEGRDPIQDFITINEELRQYGFRLLERPMIVVANKMDDDGAWLLLDEFKNRFGNQFEIFPISALQRTGIDELLYRVSDLLESTPEFPLVDESLIASSTYIYQEKAETDFKITRLDQKTWKVSGDKIEKFYYRTNLTTDEGVMYLLAAMRKMGIEEALQESGIQDGDTVKLCDFEFDYFE